MNLEGLAEGLVTAFGPAGIVIVPLIAVIVYLARKNDQLHEARLTELKDHTKERIEDSRRFEDQMQDNNKTLQQALAIFEARSNV